ncbi:MAG: hypothetical protein ABIY52_07870 [Gemmatimonadaceae bacterium]
MASNFASWIVVAPALLLPSGGRSAPPEKVQLTIATLHAAALTTPRVAGDSTDAPFFVVRIVGPRASSASILPNSAVRTIRQDEQLSTRPLTELSLAEGDSVEVQISVLENAEVQAAVASPSNARAASPADQVDQATRLVAPLVKEGATWLGSVSLLLTNEGGSVYWRRLDCVTSCKVLSSPAATALPASKQQASGVVELSGAGGTYHLALRANRA